jgi:hypothetical protein
MLTGRSIEWWPSPDGSLAAAFPSPPLRRCCSRGGKHALHHGGTDADRSAYFEHTHAVGAKLAYSLFDRRVDWSPAELRAAL